MLKNSFQHIPGIGPKSEQQLWESGLINWKSFLDTSGIKLSKTKLSSMKDSILESNRHIDTNPKFFCDLLPSSQHWRIFDEFRESTAYIDIETTGLEMWASKITTIALYDGKEIKYYVNGKNLGDFIDDINQYNTIVTYNGKTFDVPFIENFFRTRLKHAHIDLRYILKALGYSGGLKKCEKSMGINRSGLEGVDGFFAILLWNDYQKNKNEKALETLLAYNIEDVVNLETLMIKAYNENIQKIPYLKIPELQEPGPVKLPFRPDKATIARIKQEIHSSYRFDQYRR